MPCSALSMKKFNKAAEHYPYTFKKARGLCLQAFTACGPRPYQQDKYCAFNLDPSSVTPANLTSVFTALQEATAKMCGYSGTTANIALVGAGKILSANIGDSQTALFTRSTRERELKISLLSTSHTTRNTDEITRLQPFVDSWDIFINRNIIIKNDGDRSVYLRMTRALGQHSFGNAVLHTPSQIMETSLDQNSHSLYYLVLYTDGATDGRNSQYLDFAYYLDHYAKALQKRLNADFLAFHMGLFALAEDPTDNITIVALDLKKFPPNSAVLIAVFDGNGNSGDHYAEQCVTALTEHPITLDPILL